MARWFRMGSEKHFLLVLKSIREQIGKTFGDEIQVSVESDTEPRVVEVPSDLAKTLKQEKFRAGVFPIIILFPSTGIYKTHYGGET